MRRRRNRRRGFLIQAPEILGDRELLGLGKLDARDELLQLGAIDAVMAETGGGGSLLWSWHVVFSVSEVSGFRSRLIITQIPGWQSCLPCLP